LADFVAEVGCEFVSGWGVFLEACPPADPTVAAGNGGTAVGTRCSRNTRGRPIRWTKRQFGGAAQILGNGSERELELCSGRAAQS
jgi:hypothetical protein